MSIIKSPYLKRPLLLATLSSFLLTTLAACNTMEGVGEDVKAAGDKIDESAEKNNTYERRSQ